VKILFYSTRDFEQEYLIAANKNVHVVNFIPESLSESTVGLATGYDVISVSAGDDASAPVIKKLNHAGVRCIAIRGIDYDNVDILKAKELGIRVANTPHQTFATTDKIINISAATFYNINCWAKNKTPENELSYAKTKFVKNNYEKINSLNKL